MRPSPAWITERVAAHGLRQNDHRARALATANSASAPAPDRSLASTPPTQPERITLPTASSDNHQRRVPARALDWRFERSGHTIRLRETVRFDC